ncbi:aldehyde ferredoxin oxidoreductase family protein [Chloroflexota bacterium]
MSSLKGGYAGKTLCVDLSSGKISKQDTDSAILRSFIGGVGLSSKILYDEVGTNVEPLSPDNLLILAVGPLTGTSAPGCSRLEVTTKSPLTGIFGSSSSGGFWAATLKHAGYDAIIIKGKSQKKVYLCLDNDEVTLRDAGHLWGKDTWETTDMLNKELGSPASGFKVMAIGPAGENLVKFACPITEYYHAPARSGAGAVMGSKNLKAIAVRGIKGVPLARGEEFKKAAREATNLLRTHPYFDHIRSISSLGAMEMYANRGCLPGKNFQSGVLPGFVETKGLELVKKYVTKKVGTCYRCPMSCFDMAEVNEGKYAGLKISSATFVSCIFSFGAKCAVETLPAIWKCKEVAHRLGMDQTSTAGLIAWAMELYQRGIITKKDADGLELGWGNEDAMLELMDNIAYRKGLGHVLAEGSVRAAKEIGRGSENYVMTIKGLEMDAADSRSGKKGYCLGFIFSPRGGDNIATMHSRPLEAPREKWGIDKYDMPAEVKEKIYGVSPGIGADTFESKALLVKWVNDLCSALSAAGACIFPTTRLVALGPTQYSSLISAATGWEMTPEEFMKSGERIANLQRAYDVRGGITRKDDNWPARFYNEPLPEGPSKGAVLSKEAVDKAIDAYYELRGWDKKSGVPTREKLAELGLEDVAGDLKKLGKLPV